MRLAPLRWWSSMRPSFGGTGGEEDETARESMHFGTYCRAVPARLLRARNREDSGE